LWAALLSLLFGAVLAWYLVYTRQLVSAVNADAAALSRMYAQVLQGVSDPDRESFLVLFDMLEEIEAQGVPVVVIAEDGQIGAVSNLPFVHDPSDPDSRQRVLEYAALLDERNEPLIEEGIGVIHFGMPAVVERLRWVPWIQAATLIVIVLTAIWIFRQTVRAEQERVWATMARESAHQLSTPLSSLSGWVEILRMPADERAGVASEDRIAQEVEVDVERLNKVAQRFELIGRRPRMATVDVGEVLQRLEGYFAARLPRLDRSIELTVQVAPQVQPVAGNPVLLEWAFENVIKNAVDVLAGRGGKIAVSAEPAEDDRCIVIRFVDDGPGVPPELRKHVFEPGVSSKERGWGVGLTLTRRIVEETHGGSIVLGKRRQGAEFVVTLPVVRSDRTT
ncbi:MAG: HAMP domain-containing sensor histidine kinase, partial [Gemmatimonadales bacterium]